MASVLIIIFLLFFMYLMLIHPLILLLRCLVDHKFSGSGKFLVFVTSLFVYPIPSYAYGAFVKNGVLSKIMIVFIGLLYSIMILGLAVGFFIGGMEMVYQSLGSYKNSIERTAGIDFDMFSPKVEEPQPVYSGENTYAVGEMQVFKSGRGADKSAPPPVAKAAPSITIYDACVGASVGRMSADQCRCVADGFEINTAVKTVMLGKGPYHRENVRKVLIQFFDALRDNDVAYQKQMRELKATDPVVADSSKSLGILFANCKVGK